MSQLLDDLIWLREFLTPDTWTIGGLAYDMHDRDARRRVAPDSPEAKCFCITGAILRRIPLTEAEHAEYRVKSVYQEKQHAHDPITYSPIPWIEPRRRNILLSLELRFHDDKVSSQERFQNWRRRAEYQKFSNSEIQAMMDFQVVWMWNDHSSLKKIHLHLDDVIRREKAKLPKRRRKIKTT